MILRSIGDKDEEVEGKVINARKIYEVRLPGYNTTHMMRGHDVISLKNPLINVALQDTQEAPFYLHELGPIMPTLEIVSGPYDPQRNRRSWISRAIDFFA